MVIATRNITMNSKFKFSRVFRKHMVVCFQSPYEACRRKVVGNVIWKHEEAQLKTQLR